MVILTAERGTPEWRAAHRMKLSASDMPALFSRRGCKTWARLVERVVLDFEGIDQHTDEHPDPWAETHEIEINAAVARYVKATGSTVSRVGLCGDSLFTWLAASPHALVDETGVMYARIRRHARTWTERHRKLTMAEVARIQVTMRVCERAWCDVVDYWDAGEFDKISRQRVELDPGFFTEHFLPRAVLFWQAVAQMRQTRAK